MSTKKKYQTKLISSSECFASQQHQKRSSLSLRIYVHASSLYANLSKSNQNALLYSSSGEISENRRASGKRGKKARAATQLERELVVVGIAHARAGAQRTAGKRNGAKGKSMGKRGLYPSLSLPPLSARARAPVCILKIRPYPCLVASFRTLYLSLMLYTPSYLPANREKREGEAFPPYLYLYIRPSQPLSLTLPVFELEFGSDCCRRPSSLSLYPRGTYGKRRVRARTCCASSRARELSPSMILVR